MKTMQDLYPVMIIEDRYMGVYSSGTWLAVANATALVGAVSRMAFVVNGDGEAPSSDDGGAMAYWIEPDEWIATGADPNEALQNLLNGVRPSGFGMGQ